jgi:hypothetical protein
MSAGMTSATMLGNFTLPPPNLPPAVVTAAVQAIQQAEAANPLVTVIVQQVPQFIDQQLTRIAASNHPAALQVAEQVASDVLFILSQVGTPTTSTTGM